ncbi:hypothetical protein D1007_25452 [Hordeum vulgare]|nr:hypothetical protein D1007_25452 [Hordeum vulgare]
MSHFVNYICGFDLTTLEQNRPPRSTQPKACALIQPYIRSHPVTIPRIPHLLHCLHIYFTMPPQGSYLRTPDATPGSFDKILRDFTRNPMGSPHPSQFELFKSRITPTASKYLAVVHIPPVNPNEDPTEVYFSEKSIPIEEMAIEVAAYEGITCFQFTVPYDSEWGYYNFLIRAAPGEAPSFPRKHAKRDPVLIKLVQYVIAQERLTKQVMDFLETLAVMNP